MHKTMGTWILHGNSRIKACAHGLQGSLGGSWRGRQLRPARLFPAADLVCLGPCQELHIVAGTAVRHRDLGSGRCLSSSSMTDIHQSCGTVLDDCTRDNSVMVGPGLGTG